MYDRSCLNKIRAQEIALGIRVNNCGGGPCDKTLGKTRKLEEDLAKEEVLFEVHMDYGTGESKYIFPKDKKSEK